MNEELISREMGISTVHGGEDVNDELEGRIDELELTARALRQYVPSRTEKDRVPVSRRKR